jgi:hypothetical protein
VIVHVRLGDVVVARGRVDGAQAATFLRRETPPGAWLAVISEDAERHATYLRRRRRRGDTLQRAS